MTLIEMVPPATQPASGRFRVIHAGREMDWARRTRPVRSRPGGARTRYRGSGVLMSRTSHRPPPIRPITAVTAVALALGAALITVWLGVLAHFGGVAAGSAGTRAAVPEQLGVVRVQTGESLQHLAVRVAPDAPTGQVVDRIRELNRLDSVVLDAGQILIAPIG